MIHFKPTDQHGNCQKIVREDAVTFDNLSLYSETIATTRWQYDSAGLLVTQLQLPIFSVLLLTDTGQVCCKDCIHVWMLLGVTLQYVEWLKCVYKMYFYGHVASPNREQLWSKSCRQQTSPKGFVGFKVNLAVTYNKRAHVLARNISLRASAKKAVHNIFTCRCYRSINQTLHCWALTFPAWETENSRETKRILTDLLSTIQRQTICTRLQEKCKPPLQQTWSKDSNELGKSCIEYKPCNILRQTEEKFQCLSNQLQRIRSLFTTICFHNNDDYNNGLDL